MTQIKQNRGEKEIFCICDSNQSLYLIRIMQLCDSNHMLCMTRITYFLATTDLSDPNQT